MKTILVPTDFSSRSLQALNVAVELAQINDARVVLLGIIKYPELILADEAHSQEEMDDQFEARVEKVENRLRSLLDQPCYQKVPVSAIVDRENRSIGETIASNKVDLIVMASEGAQGWKERTTGSNAERVIRHAACPVLIVKNDKPLRLKKVLFPTDFTNVESIRQFMDLPGMRSAEHYFLTVNPGYMDRSYDDLADDMEILANQLNVEPYRFSVIEAVSEEAGILRYAEEIEADLIALYTHGRTGLSHWYHGSIAEKVANHSAISVLTLVQQGS